MIIIEISKEPTELYKILKFESLVSSGGEAKTVIANGLVMLNGQVETRKRKKIVSGDIIEFAGEKMSVKLNLALLSKKKSTVKNNVVDKSKAVDKNKAIDKNKVIGKSKAVDKRKPLNFSAKPKPKK